ncbi:MAG: hypothetical protein AAGJ93_07230, partial [Bacteroidota bacterium]
MQFRLPLPAIKEISSIALPTLDGQHPSQFSFAIHNANSSQIEAWMKGDFRALQGLFLVNNEEGSSKGQMFSDVQSAITQARRALDTIRQIGNFISQFDGQSIIKLPVGLSAMKEDGTQFTVVIQRISLFPTHAELTVFAEAKTADMEKSLYLGSPDIRFTRRGGISLGDLGLLGDFSIPIMEGNGFLEFNGAVVEDNEFVPGYGTYVSFDCDGLNLFNLDVDLALSRSVAVPAFNSDPNARVVANLGLTVSEGSDGLNGFNEIMASVDVDVPFYHPAKEDIIWYLDELIFDFSETTHPPELSFPVAGYTPAVAADPDEVEMLNNWKGIYIKNFIVKLPEDLFGEGDGFDINYLSAHDVIIDQSGFTGFVGV